MLSETPVCRSLVLPVKLCSPSLKSAGSTIQMRAQPGRNLLYDDLCNIYMGEFRKILSPYVYILDVEILDNELEDYPPEFTWNWYFENTITAKIIFGRNDLEILHYSTE